MASALDSEVYCDQDEGNKDQGERPVPRHRSQDARSESWNSVKKAGPRRFLCLEFTFP